MVFDFRKRGNPKSESYAAPQPASDEGGVSVLAYGLPFGGRGEEYPMGWEQVGNLHVLNMPIGAPESFLEHDLVALFAGAFEEVNGSQVVGFDAHDLDLRHREFHTMLKKRKTFIFLLSRIRASLPIHTDLFRRIAAFLSLEWTTAPINAGSIDVSVPEFAEFLDHHGSVHNFLGVSSDKKANWTVIAGWKKAAVGLCYENRVFFLPARYPRHNYDAVEIVASAAACVLKYQQRISEELPNWLADFVLHDELALRQDVTELESVLLEKYAAIESLEKLKGVLCHQSAPLVRVVRQILEEHCGFRLDDTDEYIEDLTVLNDEGDVLALMEVKGVSRNFNRQDINQADSHRERRGLSTETPVILIMNTVRNVQSVELKDEHPHPDIIKKAVQDNVLMLRTLDLLRYVNLIQKETATSEELRKTMLTEVGWLEVTDGMRVHHE